MSDLEVAKSLAKSQATPDKKSHRAGWDTIPGRCATEPEAFFSSYDQAAIKLSELSESSIAMRILFRALS